MKTFKIFLLSAFLCVLGFGIYLSLSKSELSNLHQVRIEGASPETTRRLEALLENLKGVPFWKIDVNSVAASLKGDAWVDSAKVHRQLPNILVISVNERKPV